MFSSFSVHISTVADEEDMEREVVSSANDVDDVVRVTAAVAVADEDGPEALFTSGEPTKK